VEEEPAAAAIDPGAEPAAETIAPASDPNAAPLPRPRPELSEGAAANLLATQFYGFAPDLILRAALDAVDDGRYADARAAVAQHKNPLVPALIEWLIAREPDSGMSAGKVIEILMSHRGWPEPETLQLRAEQAFHAFGPPGDSVLTFYTQVEPITAGGRMALAGALRDAGRTEEATDIARALWRDWSLAPSQAASLLTRFGAVLTTADHLYRFRRLVLRRRTDDAVAQAQLLGPGYDKLARAVIAVLNDQEEGRQLLRDVAPKFLGDPLYVFARVQRLLKTGQPIEAARFLLGSEPDMDLSGDGDIWWEQRQDLSRMLLDRGAPDLAYRVVAGARPEGEGDRVAAEFHAGWYALRFLDDPSLAEPHFRELHILATLPRTRARASYWLGRTHEAEGKKAAARLDYVEAARFGGSFYGQLAREKLGIRTTGLERMPRPSAIDRLRFANRDLVKVVRLMAAAGYADRSLPFLRALGKSVDTPGEVALLTTLARRIGRPQAGIQAAALAEERGLKVASLPALFFGVPPGLRPPGAVDRALVYAVVRQESAFNHTAVSHAGARGLMQLMPATAKATARIVKIPYSEQRLLTDPLYNATLGAHHLGELLGGLRRSYLLTFAGYNAGAGRALEWVRSYGDPRGGAVDPVDWIERIPFDETRDYVQKVMENLQLYRSRIGHPLSLTEDLVRGGPQG
jgi:soluble lytic murein transglycosylase